MRVAAAQMGPIGRDESRAEVVERLLALLRRAADDGAELVAFPELALTSFFPRWVLEGDELDAFYETEMPGPETKPLFDEAARLGVGFALGYAELTDGHHYNTTVLVDGDGDDRRPLPQGPPPRPRGARGLATVPAPRAGATSSRATASRRGRPSGPRSAWPPATTGAGPRPTGC